MKRFLLCALAGLTLTGCAGLHIDTTHTSKNQDSRVLFLVMHYTVGDFNSSLKTLTEPSRAPVSSHYLVSESPPRIYRLVDESQRAWHAGPSYWKGHSQLNASSIGIEIVNRGGRKNPDGTWDFAPFPQEQIDAVIALSRDIMDRHKIRPDRVVGHGEIQPRSKQDPGPLFPWRQLAQAGLIPWPDEALVAQLKLRYEQQLPDIAWFQNKLAEHGFAASRSGEDDAYTRDQLIAFQMRYRPARHDGVADAETAALLDACTRPDGLKFARPPERAPYTSRF
ncbi:N-acetylmuramoyl-L-alanine amidase [Inhella gelatinilytica]|uniref:N-acetylmuramoyl-L-alanine amidase n=1 Tax=Inhella gelatinilytica TaxID=2795030 RepID=A0A931IXV4_9BURK|nr:N-acetylmuramoyl-L-alanine amidase [Inhella gelatinilytica]MBH9552628.1 N-acetylmuramoyl-L-alanine amidase [Inhella gelatinilytica]